MGPPTWAYQLENFTPAPHDELVCSICRCVFCEPVECNCRHVFCNGCICKWIGMHKNCPICRKHISVTSLRPVNHIIRNLILGLTLHCKNFATGCNCLMTLEICEAHLKICEFEMEDCVNGCGKSLVRKDMEKHRKDDCPFRECEQCGLKIHTSRANHDCVEDMRAALIGLREANSELEKRLHKLQQQLDQAKKDIKTATNRLPPLSLDELWSSCYESSDNELPDASADEPWVLPTESSVSDDANDSLVSSSESEVSTSIDPIISFPQESVVISDDSQPGEGNSDIIVDLGFANLSEYTTNAATVGSLRRTSVIDLTSPVGTETEDSSPRRPLKRRLRISSPRDSSDSDGEDMGARKAQRSSSNEDGKSAAGVSGWTSPISRMFRAIKRSKDRRTQRLADDLSQPSTSAQPSGEGSCAMGGQSSSDTEDAFKTSMKTNIFERTLALLEKHNLDSDPDWLPTSDDDSDYFPLHLIRSSSEANSSSTSSSSSDVDTESSYEVQIPTPTYDLLQRYGDYDSDNDPDWMPKIRAKPSP